MTAQTRTLAVLAILKEKGPMTHIDLERRLEMRHLSRDLSAMEQAHLISGTVKPGRPRTFKITSQGHDRLRGQREPYSAAYTPYTPPPAPYIRPGAAQALAIPSRGFPT
jgi:DNA-binding PadR family transcriptional regulator